MTTFRVLLAAICLFATVQTSIAQTVPPALGTAFNQTLKTYRNSLGVKSLSAAVQLSDEAIWTGAYGTSTTFPIDSVTPEYSYAIGSITKTITAACILQLADEGVLKLDDSLSKWLPPFPYVNPNITIRQLLRHQSGLFDVITSPAYDAATKVDLDSVWSLYNLVNDYIQPPLFAPGASWSYSNTNYALLGMIIEAATGNNYREAFSARFFGPLQLGSLVLPPYDPSPADIAHLWVYNPSTGSSSDAHNFYVNWYSFRTSAGPIGGYYALPRDIAVWNRAFLRGDLHSPAILAEAKTTVTTTMPNNGRYGLGIMERKFLGLTAYGHGGDIGYSSITYYFPQKDISITVFNNDAKKNSWDLAPVVQALLKNYLDYESSVDVATPLDVQALETSVYPNPFVGQLQVSLQLPVEGIEGQLTLRNVLGEQVAQTALEPMASGEQLLSLKNLEKLPSGVYFGSVVLDGRLLKSFEVFK